MLAAFNVAPNGPQIGLRCRTMPHDTTGLCMWDLLYDIFICIILYIVPIGMADCAAGGVDDNADDGANAGWSTFEVWSHVCHCFLKS